jgi:hypothetical protein
VLFISPFDSAKDGLGLASVASDAHPVVTTNSQKIAKEDNNLFSAVKCRNAGLF